MKEKQTSPANTKNYEWRKLLIELLVVFLGVTAGFLLNNWQLQKKDLALEEKYLDGFLQDINDNIVELKNALHEDSLWLSQTRPSLLLMKEGALPAQIADSLVSKIVSISKIDIQKGTYQDITNSGNLNLLTNFEIKKQIVDYHVNISGLEFINNYFYDFFADFVMPFVFEHYSVLQQKLLDPGIVNTDKFGNVITGYYAMVQQRKAAHEDLLKQSNQLKNKLEGNKK